MLFHSSMHAGANERNKIQGEETGILSAALKACLNLKHILELVFGAVQWVE